MSKQHYPDIFGVISSERLTIQESVQCALGIFPTTTVLDQPVEVLLLLQSLIDQPLAVQIVTLLPMRDGQGNLINIFTPKPKLVFTLPGGDCGLLHIPITPQLPTPACEGYPVQVQIAIKKPPQFVQIRPLAEGEPPNLLALSKTRIGVLRDISFGAQISKPYHLCVTFNVQPGLIPPPDHEPMPRYEPLWTIRDLEQEQEQIKTAAASALRFARSLDRNILFPLLSDCTRDMFGDAGIPLHPGEALFIARALLYVMEDGLELEEGFSLAEGYWFQRLCWLMTNQPQATENLETLIPLLYTSIVQDAVMLGFNIVGLETHADFGNEYEQISYAARLVAALERRAPLGLEHIYVPLILSSAMLAARVKLGSENPWQSLALLKEARGERIGQTAMDFREVFDILDSLIEREERLLREMRVPRGGA